MYAIIRTGGKQYKVQPGDVIRVEKLDQQLGSEFDLSDVLMVGGETPVVGQPTVQGAKVTLVVTKQAKDRKVIIFKKKRRQGYRRFKTHRQMFTELFVKAISHGGKTAKADSDPVVIDVDQARQEKIQARTAAKESARAAKPGEEIIEKAAKKVAKKTTAKKKAPAKKAGKKPAKKAGAKKTAKKTTKKA
ncbi:MAG: hypothetical protein BroJett040_08790 [Oligoflexia bacterium]|nr:MAG: hypothetical protein BroJett040_08790 [Oligoflexia bacterium]